MDGVKALFLGAFGNVGFAGTGAVLGFYPQFKVFLCAVCDDFAQKFSEFGCMFGFLPSRLFPVKTDFGVAFPESDTRHSQVHANFTAFTGKVCL
jgi:hypothetical protein